MTTSPFIIIAIALYALACILSMVIITKAERKRAQLIIRNLQATYQYRFSTIKTRLQNVVESVPVKEVNNTDPQLIADFEKRFQSIRLLTLIAIKDCTDPVDIN